MMSKNFLRLFAAMFMMLGFISTQAQTAVHPKAYYDAITYQWTDASGVTHENAITDEATNPYQIVALLKKIYCDPNIPGPTHSAYNQNGNREREVYYGPIGGGWNISADDVTPPYEDGYTILMVAVSENLSLYGGDTQQQTGTTGWLNPRPTYDTFSSNFFTQTSELINYIGNNVTAVQLLTDGLRIGEGKTAGTAFNISGTYDRFFMIGKGQARQKDPSVINDIENGYPGYEIIAGERVPFKFMFEQFSPTTGEEGSEITDFYASMVGGELYGVIHDCASVIEVEHYFSMAGKNNHEPRSLTGLNIFIPDYRLDYWENTYTYNNRNYTVDGRTMNPYKSTSGNNFRTVPNLCANYAQYNPNKPPMVGIYTIKLNGKAEPTAEDKVYNVVLDWTSSLDEMSGGNVGEDFILYLVVTDEDGVEVYQELITTTESTYTYPVPQDEHSYTLTYIVYGQPNDGEHDMFIAWSNEADVVIPGWNDFLSLKLNHFESDYRGNVELNYYRNFMNVKNDAVNGLTTERVNAGENSFTLYRFDMAAPDAKVPVATLTLTASYNGTRYNIEYQNQEPLPGYNVPVTTNGNLTVGAGNTIDLSNILFVDQFTASTALNEHPSRYGYVLMLNNATTEKSTNTVEVPVYKTNAKLDGYYTEEEILDDVEPALATDIKNANVEMNILLNPNVYYYTLERGDNKAPDTEISNLQHRTDGTFIETNNFLGMAGDIYEPGIINRYDNDVITGLYGNYMTYQPVIWTFGDDRVKNDGENSYGSEIMKTGVAKMTVTLSGTRSDNQYSNWQDENDEWCSIYNPVITVNADMPDYASVEYEPYMVRVWRDCDKIRNSFIEATWGVRTNDIWSPREPHKLIAEQLLTDGDTQIELGDAVENTLAFGGTNDATISFVVRLYYKVVNEAKAGDAPMYYVIEKVVPWENIPTSVAEFSVASEGVNTYYNAQGMKSDKPFDGVNIVVTRYSDGSTKTTKMVH